MCVAVPMKVLSVDKENDIAIVSLSGNTIQVNISLISPNVGDFVLVHAGCAIEIIKKDEADEILEIFEELKEISKK